MKRLLQFVSVVMLVLLIVGLTGCSESKVELVDISDSIQYTSQEDYAILTGFEGNQEYIELPEWTTDGVYIKIIHASFAEGKTIKAVKLPSSINAFVRQDGKLLLCGNIIENSVAIGAGNAAAVYCEFFNTDKIIVNGTEYTKSEQKAESFDLSGNWKSTDIIAGVKYTQAYTFADGKVTCDADGDIFEGTYEIKDSKLYVTLNDVVAEFEIVGDNLICWEYGITLSTKDITDYSQTSESGWSYIVTSSGYAQLTGYHGDESTVTVPLSVDGYEVSSINSCVADTYNFTNLSFKGHGSINFSSYFNWLYYDELTGNYILYGDTNKDGNEVIVLCSGGPYGNSSGICAEAYCRVFGQSKITIDGKEYTSSSATEITEEDVVGRWQPSTEGNYGTMILSLYEGGATELHYYADMLAEECSNCRTGTYTISGTTVTAFFDDGVLTLDYFNTTFISWAKNDLLRTIRSNTAAVDFGKANWTAESGAFVHITPNAIVGKYVPFVEDGMVNYLDFKSDGTAVVTMAHQGWYDAVVSYSYENDVVVLSDGMISESLSVENDRLVDRKGNTYWPVWHPILQLQDQ